MRHASTLCWSIAATTCASFWIDTTYARLERLSRCRSLMRGCKQTFKANLMGRVSQLSQANDDGFKKFLRSVFPSFQDCSILKPRPAIIFFS